MQKIVAATANKHKIQEISAILAGSGFVIVSRDEAGVPKEFDVEENGATFEENSFIKAEAIMKLTGMPAIADDSGLMVDALDGAPGVYSARFAGDESDDEKNNDKLLVLMEDVPDEKRTAKFVSVITLLFPDGEKIVARGECPGHVLWARRGTGGFGYDPLFLPDESTLTFAEMGSEEKNTLSHRARALEKLEVLLKNR